VRIVWDPTNVEEADLQQNILDAVRGGFSVLSEIRNRVFRPARKHGYSDHKIRELLQKIPDGLGEELVSELERIYGETIEEQGLRGYS